MICRTFESVFQCLLCWLDDSSSDIEDSFDEDDLDDEQVRAIMNELEDDEPAAPPAPAPALAAIFQPATQRHRQDVFHRATESWPVRSH